MNYNNYGIAFKKIRENQNFSLTQITRGITSPATLSRWENGKGEMYFDKVVQLLQRMNIYLDEFVNISQNSRKENIAIMNSLRELQKAYSENDSEKLKQLANSQYRIYKLKNKELDFFLFAIICNCYRDVTGKNIFNIAERAKLSSIFEHVKNWNKYYIRAFGNTVALLNVKQIVEISDKILSYVGNNFSWQNISQISEAVLTLLNASTILMQKDVDRAESLINRLDKIEIPVELSFLKMKILFLRELVSYKKIPNYSVKKMNNLVGMLRILHYDEVADEWCDLFKKMASKKS